MLRGSGHPEQRVERGPPDVLGRCGGLGLVDGIFRPPPGIAFVSWHVRALVRARGWRGAVWHKVVCIGVAFPVSFGPMRQLTLFSLHNCAMGVQSPIS